MRTLFVFCLVAAGLAASPSAYADQSGATPPRLMSEQLYVGSGECIWSDNGTEHGVSLLAPILQGIAQQGVKTIVQALRDAAQPIRDVRTGSRAIVPGRCIQVVSGQLDDNQSESDLADRIGTWGWTQAPGQTDFLDLSSKGDNPDLRDFAHYAARVLTRNGLPLAARPRLILEARFRQVGVNSNNQPIFVLDPVFVAMEEPWSRPLFRLDRRGEREIAMTVRVAGAPGMPDDKSSVFAIRFGRRSTGEGRQITNYLRTTPSADASYAQPLAWGALQNLQVEVIEEAPGSRFNQFWADVLSSDSVTTPATQLITQTISEDAHAAANASLEQAYRQARTDLVTLQAKCPAAGAQTFDSWATGDLLALRSSFRVFSEAATTAGHAMPLVFPRSPTGTLTDAIAVGYAQDVARWCRSDLRNYLITQG